MSNVKGQISNKAQNSNAQQIFEFGHLSLIKTTSENPVLWTGMKDASAEGRRNQARC